MTDTSPRGRSLFGRYAYPPNELGYCGPTTAGGASGLASHAREFDGAWPYLSAIAEAIGASDVLDEQVVGGYWVGGRALGKVDPDRLLTRLRSAFRGQVTGLLDAVPATTDVLAHHSFHVFVVYPWVRFLRRDATTALGVLQDCRIRWGTVVSVAGEHTEIAARPLQYTNGCLMLGEPRTECVGWEKGGLSLAPPPEPGAVVSAHWDWVCGTLTEEEGTELEAATQTTLDLVNAVLGQEQSI
ncbi:DUF6390 family protein [Mycobacterium sp. E740]|uniref:DUF6390 family protein n=1 Tax=Mycobacterium sp. E740 TaxID=1834149 RepID=UPI0007FFE1A5|nr:DUF6390 family protein [Mycobacterium sp. E740]OBI78351.1 hypothetical protein A5663_20385 [Mycobacterium sp. E740]